MDLELFFYVLITEYWWVVSIFCLIVMFLPIVIKMLIDFKNEINE